MPIRFAVLALAGVVAGGRADAQVIATRETPTESAGVFGWRFTPGGVYGVAPKPALWRIVVDIPAIDPVLAKPVTVGPPLAIIPVSPANGRSTNWATPGPVTARPTPGPGPVLLRAQLQRADVVPDFPLPGVRWRNQGPFTLQTLPPPKPAAASRG